MNDKHTSLNLQLANELQVTIKQVDSFITLYDDGNTVPFIARYRKEMTEGLDDTQLRLLETRLIYMRELYERRDTIIKSLVEQNKLTDALSQQLNAITSKNELERLYLPYKSKRVSKSELAIAAGLEPLADILWFQDDGSINNHLVRKYINLKAGYTDPQLVLDGALAILIERICRDSIVIDLLYKHLFSQAALVCKAAKGVDLSHSKFKDYADYSERVNKIPAHRILAIMRGKTEGALQVKLESDPGKDKSSTTSYCEILIARHLGFSLTAISNTSWRAQVIKKAWKARLQGQLETQIFAYLKEKASDNAIDIFASNLKELLMAAPAGNKVVLGLDPGFRTGCKISVIDETGKLLDYATIYPHPPQLNVKQAQQKLTELIEKYSVDLIAIGNGTASRETDLLVRELIPNLSRTVTQLIVSEAGASVYSASELASQEFPDLDVSIRGAVSIARRLQDPLAELVKIDAKAIGVGLYQHDLNQMQLAQRLQAVVEDCVNSVGVDLNSASASLLSFVAGLNSTVAQNIIDYRDQHGAFTNRNSLKKVPRLGNKAFQQSAGFLRIANAKNPLDNSAVHPESYPLVTAIAEKQGVKIAALIQNETILNKLQAEDFVTDKIGLLTVKDIINELIKPSRDPRPTFTTVRYAKGIDKITDLQVDMLLQGVISNVTSFGAFVDIGVHQDGLVHISQLADRFVSDPLQVVKPGQIVQVKVTQIDIDCKRIALTMRL
ncbi:Tex family protein [Psychromonas sp. MME1]|uniref:Tex family protein n=1 Tax=Psychromonas sp. MME1 TaxID=3231032 RepID=UPI0034E223D2